MFTGIEEKTAKVLKNSDNKLSIERVFNELKIGQSIAVNGACLTITDFDNKQINFDVMDETFSRTNLKEAKIVNLDRALLANSRFEGHVVLGHIDGILEFLNQNGEIFTFKKPKNYDKYFVEKGSIALNGVSLTIAKDEKETFSVCLIPHTLNLTNLGNLRKGNMVNFECDIFAKLLLKQKS